ncbi:MAG TPA: hypothetical protein VF188_12750 [Longimicrobiales bacterium]
MEKLTNPASVGRVHPADTALRAGTRRAAPCPAPTGAAPGTPRAAPGTLRAPYAPPVLERLGVWRALTLQQSVPISP